MNIDQSQEPVKGQPKPTGFQIHPENINLEGGPPKTHWWSELLKERAEAEDKMKKLKHKELMADALIEKAKTGDVAAIREFGDRVQGKAPQGVGTINNDGTFNPQPLTGFVIKFVDAQGDSLPTEA
jgi:hypothetical protein